MVAKGDWRARLARARLPRRRPGPGDRALGPEPAVRLPVFGVSEAMAAVRAGHPAVVALAGDELIGAVVARVDGERAWILLIALAARWRNRGVGSSLLAGLEGRLRGLHVRRVSAVVPEDAAGSVAMRNSGYQVRDGLTYYEKVEHFSGDAGLLAALGGRVLPRGLWDTVAGMEAEKDGHRAADRAAAGPSRAGRALRGRAAEGGHPVRPAGHRARPASPRRWRPGWTGRSSSSSRPGWPPTATGSRRAAGGLRRPGRPRPRSWSSSTRWRRSPAYAPATPPTPATA